MTDCVSREAVLNMAYRSLTGRNVVDVDDIEDLPPVTPERPKGEWKKISVQAGAYVKERFKCSECGNEELWMSRYCPECGARMDGEQE